MLLRLDHLILRTADPRATLAELAQRLGAPVLEPVQQVSGLASGIVRVGALDLEVLALGASPPARVSGYGLGFVSDVGLGETSAALRERGFATSAAARASVDGRAWRAIQVRGLLPDPFPVPASTRRPGLVDRATETAAKLMITIPGLARAATRNAGGSMVVVTEYDFDAAAWRSAAGHGPDVLVVEVGTGGLDWSRLPLEPGSPLTLRSEGPPGITRIVLEGDADDFDLGDVVFEFSRAA